MRRQRFDEYEAAQAKLLQDVSPGWIVMWRPYARTYSAWNYRDPAVCRLRESKDLDELRTLMANADLELWRVSRALPRQPTPMAAGEARQT